MDTKVCTKCGVEHPATKEYFVSEKRNRSGLGARCKKCAYIQSRAWAIRNLERIRKCNKESYQRNKEKYIAFQKNNPERYRKSLRKYRKTLRGYVCNLVSAIRQRCNNPNNPAYKHYGKRGIYCYFTWTQLLNWLIAKGIDPRGKNIHRINNDGNYSLDNITFMDGGLHTSLHKSKVRV